MSHIIYLNCSQHYLIILKTKKKYFFPNAEFIKLLRKNTLNQVNLKLAFTATTTKDNAHILIRFEPSTNVSLNPNKENVYQGTIYDYNMDSMWSAVVNIS